MPSEDPWHIRCSAFPRFDIGRAPRHPGRARLPRVWPVDDGNVGLGRIGQPFQHARERRPLPASWLGNPGSGSRCSEFGPTDCRHFRRHCLAFAPESRIFFTTPFASGTHQLMNYPAFERRESTPISALAAVLAAAIVLSVGGTTGSLGGLAPAAVGAVLIGGIGCVAANAANPLADSRTAPRIRPVTSAGSSDHEAHPAVSILRMSGPSGPASADLPPPTVA
jgi:hypothetical protein